jgi:predicted dehydrogenase
MARPRVAFLGLGWIGRHRLAALVNSDVVDVVALADPDAAALAAAASLAPQAVRGRTLDDVLAAGPDGLVIATPSAQHATEAIRALAGGCAVFCQKPLARSAAEASAVVAAAREHDRRLDVDLSYRHLEATRCIDGLLADGALGTLHALDLTFHNAYGPGQPWYYDRALAGGGCLLDLGIHLVDLLARWTHHQPFVVSAAAMSTKGRPWSATGAGVEDFALVHLQSASGIAARVACSWGTPSGCDAVIEARLFGTRAGAQLRNVGGSFYDFAADLLEAGRRVSLAQPPDDWGGRAAVAWARALAEGARFDPAADRLTEVSATLDRAYDAAAAHGGRRRGTGRGSPS